MQHISPSFDLLLVLRESGDDPAAIALAQSVLDRAHAWAAETPQDLATTLVFAEKLFNMGALTREQFDEARNRWFAATSIKPTAEPASSGGELGHIAPWFVGYADVDTREAAIEALETLPRYGKLPPPGLMNTGADLMVGKLFALADRGPEALPYLQTVSRSCLQLMNPHAYGQALVWLGRVSESVGDLPAAREAYGRVLARWGKSRPRSVTAEKAAERLAALGAN